MDKYLFFMKTASITKAPENEVLDKWFQIVISVFILIMLLIGLCALLAFLMKSCKKLSQMISSIDGPFNLHVDTKIAGRQLEEGQRKYGLEMKEVRRPESVTRMRIKTRDGFEDDSASVSYRMMYQRVLKELMDKEEQRLEDLGAAIYAELDMVKVDMQTEATEPVLNSLSVIKTD